MFLKFELLFQPGQFLKNSLFQVPYKGVPYKKNTCIFVIILLSTIHYILYKKIRDEIGQKVIKEYLKKKIFFSTENGITSKPTHDIRTTLLRRRFSVLTSFQRPIQRRPNVVCQLGFTNTSRNNFPNR